MNRKESNGKRLLCTSRMLTAIIVLSVFTIGVAVVPSGANAQQASVTRELPVYVELNETFVVVLNQSGFFSLGAGGIGIVWEVLPEGFEYVNGSYIGGGDADWNPVMRELELQFLEDISVSYRVNASSYTQTAEFSGTWRTLDPQLNITNGTVEGDTVVVVSGTLPAPVISSSTHPDENVWYCNRNATFTWTTPPDASGIACYSYIIDNSSTTTPDTVCNTTGNSKSYTNLEYSIRYFHVRAKDNDDNWGSADHYRVKIENCDVKDGCYAYDTGCEDRDYYCSGGSCTYTYSNRHTDYYDDWVTYCKGDEVWKHRQFHDFYCEAGNCTNHTSWKNDTFVENCSDSDGWYNTTNTRWVDDTECTEKEQQEQEYRDYACSGGACAFSGTNIQWVDTGAVRNKPDGTDCGSDYYGDWVTYCKGDEVWKHRQFHDFYCEAGNCTNHTSWKNDTFVENCSDSDGWYNTTNTRWVDDTECTEKEQQEQEYRDYACSGGACAFSGTNIQWVDTGAVRNKPDGTDCGSDYYGDWVTYCKGDEVWKHRQFHDFYCEAGNCTDHTSWKNDTFVVNCSDSDGWMDTGNTSWVEDPGNECKEKEHTEQEYRDYACSDGSCDYSVTDTNWIDTGNERERIREIDVRPDICRMNISEEKQFSAIATLTAGGTEDVTLNASWSSSNTSVLEHLDGGKIKAKSEGIAEVIANYCNTSDRCMVKVNVSENQPPIANFTYSPENPVVNQTIIFNASNSTDPDGNITKYEWSFGDGNITNTTEPVISHFYASAGDYIVNLTVLDNEEAVDSTNKTIAVYPLAAGFDTDAPSNPYPSISGTHNGTIKPNVTIEVSTLYTYSCPGTGGHTKFARIWNSSWPGVEAHGNGYKGDWHNISFNPSFTLIANETYNYSMRTGSYPQIHHEYTLPAANGWINCTNFTDANGIVYYDWIPAIRLE